MPDSTSVNEIGVTDLNVDFCNKGQVSGQLLAECHVPVKLADSEVVMGDSHFIVYGSISDTPLPNIEICYDKCVIFLTRMKSAIHH